MFFAILQRFRLPLPAVVLLLISIAFCPVLLNAQTEITGFQNSAISVSPSGQFAIHVTLPTISSGWSFGGNVGAKAQTLTSETTIDSLGLCQQISFTYTVGTSTRIARIRAYQNRPLILFGVTYVNAATNVTPFPSLATYPGGLLHMSFDGEFSLPNFPGMSTDSPWVFFDTHGNTFIVSAATNFLTAATTLGPKNEIQSGVSSQIGSLPAGFTQWTALSYETGINRTMESWGNALTTLSGKIRPTSDSEPLLSTVSYWTDAGSTYYYNTAPSMDFPTTFRTIQADFRNAGIGLGSIQLDSWWYPKGPVGGWHGAGGIWNYKASKELFTQDLATVQKDLAVPLIAHARWIDAGSPLLQQYAYSGGVITDPKYWEDTATYLQSAGIKTYEQDWLGDAAHSNFNLIDPYAFFDNMAASFGKRGITMQYCMAEPKHFLQGTLYNNLTTVRSSQDRFSSVRWTEFLYSSRFASALGEFPFTDVFMSTEFQNLLFASLSAGPLGVGDPIHSISAANLNLAVRADGIIVKPDAPATPLDSVFIADAQEQAATNQFGTAPMVASTYSDFGGLRATYIVAYKRNAEVPVTIAPSAHSISGDAYLYDFFNGTAKRIPAGGTANVSMTNGFGYWILLPVGQSGIAVGGDQGHYISLGKKRISGLTDNGVANVAIEFAPGETARTIFGYSATPVYGAGSNVATGTTVYDATTEQFSVLVSAPTDGTTTAHVRLLPGLTAGQINCDHCRHVVPPGTK